MCGPIAAHASARGGIPYQAGRLAGYLVMGFLFGAAGSGVARFLIRHPGIEIAAIVAVVRAWTTPPASIVPATSVTIASAVTTVTGSTVLAVAAAERVMHPAPTAEIDRTTVAPATRM